MVQRVHVELLTLKQSVDTRVCCLIGDCLRVELSQDYTAANVAWW